MRALVLLLAGLTLQVAPNTGVIEGYVIRAKTEPAFPLVNARLELNNYVARTDSSGRFVFSGLPPGRYRLRATKDGFVRQEYPHSAMGAPGLPIDLAAGQQIRNIVFRLDPAPTISGEIRDLANNVVAGVLVQAMRRGFNPRGNRTLTLIASTKTDDRGSYRLYSLDPGEYLIAAAPDPAAPQTRGVTFGPTYFPGFEAADDARVVRVDFRDANGIDFRIHQHNLTTVFGNTISVTTGSAVAADITMVPPEEGGGVARYQTRSRLPDGDYSIPNVAAGTYILSAKTATEAFATRVLVRSVPSNPRPLQVRVELDPGVDVPGRIGLNSDTVFDMRGARVQFSETSLSLPDSEPSGIAPDGRFMLRAVQPGTYALSVTDLPDDLYLSAAVQAGENVLEKLIPIGWGPQNFRGPLDVQIGTDGGRITGVVLDPGSNPSGGAQITLIPEGDARMRTELYRTAISETEGSFTLRGVVPGNYRLFAWDDLEPNAYLNPEFMRAYQELGTSVRIQPNQRVSLSLPLLVLEGR